MRPQGASPLGMKRKVSLPQQPFYCDEKHIYLILIFSLRSANRANLKDIPASKAESLIEIIEIAVSFIHPEFLNNWFIKLSVAIVLSNNGKGLDIENITPLIN